MLPDTNFYYSKYDKTYYHELCTLANNIITLIWQKFYSEMEKSL